MAVIIYGGDTGVGGLPAEREGFSAAGCPPAGEVRGARGALGRFRRSSDRWRGRRGSGRKGPTAGGGASVITVPDGPVPLMTGNWTH